ncbi:Hcp family type VI secretion system effector [Nocardioides sp.]|uniref:Hcp family type VI secretion system effector n=1 Tax=Nocardioides sp. TaxID=35761 RepID=UPI003784864D
MTRTRTAGDLDLSASRRMLLAGALGMGGAGALAGSAAAAGPTIPDDPRVRFYLTVSGVDGESTAENHPKAIELLTWSFGVTHTVSQSGGGGGAGKPTPADFVFVSTMSKASPKLYLAACTGRHLKSATLEVVSFGEGETPTQTVVLTDVQVHSYQVAPGEVDGYPIEVGRLTYAKISLTEYVQSGDGSVHPVTVGFDFKANRPT